MKVIIDAREFPSELGLRILKAKHGDCTFKSLEDVWHSIPPLTFASIIDGLDDPDRRRIAFKHLGLQGMIEEVSPTLVSRETLQKSTTWVDADGTLTRHNFEDVYELYRVCFRNKDEEENSSKLQRFLSRNLTEQYFVKCWDTSTAKEYVIWVNMRAIYTNNLPKDKKNNANRLSETGLERKVTPVQAIAWTIRTDIEPGGIEAIVRQGDCVLLRTKPGAKRLESPRHLTEEEYLTLMSDES
jgi:hypothetical protein